MRGVESSLIGAGGMCGGGAICSVAGMFQHSDRALADQIGFSGLAAMGIVWLYALVRLFWERLP